MSKVKCNKIIFSIREINRKLEDIKDDAGYIHYVNRKRIDDAKALLDIVATECVRERSKIEEERE